MPARAPAPRPSTHRPPLVVSKRTSPRLRPGIVDRPRVLDRLLGAPDAPVVLLSAPPGYGKTTTLTLWQHRDQRPFAWVSLEGADNDPVAMSAAIIASLQPLLGLDEQLTDLAAQHPSLEAVVLPRLVNAWLAATEPFVLVLDDLHLVTDQRSLAAVAYLAEHVPAGSQLALSTRTDPALPLAGLRMHGALLELRADTLAFRHEEAVSAMAAAGVALDDATVRQLVDRTEGWPAGLYLAALSLRDRDEPLAFVEHFTGTSRHVADVLSEEVLARQTEELRSFLVQTSILAELTPDLCDAVTGGHGSGDVLRQLERSNLFVVPLDLERTAYRYHHLFAEYLRAELSRVRPRDAPELHRRAWRWYHAHGLVVRAVAHAQAAGDVDAAAHMVAAEHVLLAERGYTETVRGWLARFDPAYVEGHAPLAISAAWSAALAGDVQAARRFALAAERGTWKGRMPDGKASLESAVAIMKSAFGVARLSQMGTLAQRAADLEPQSSPHRAIALALLGVAHTLQGDLGAARTVLTEARMLAGGRTSTRALVKAHLALVSLLEGDEDAALEHAELAHALVDTPGMRSDLAGVATYSVCARLWQRRGDLRRAEEALGRAAELLPQLTESFWWLMVETRVLLAPVLAELGRADEATRRLEEAAAILAQHPDAGRLPEWHAAAVGALQAERRRPQLHQELSDAERRVLRLLASDLTAREIGRELCLSVNTVKTHTHAIYRKLGVSSRAEAVRAMHARRSTARRPVAVAEADSPG